MMCHGMEASNYASADATIFFLSLPRIFEIYLYLLSHTTCQLTLSLSLTFITVNLLITLFRQAVRTRTSDEFRSAKRGIMFSSDVTARGLDYPDVTLVLQVRMHTD